MFNTAFFVENTSLLFYILFPKISSNPKRKSVDTSKYFAIPQRTSKEGKLVPFFRLVMACLERFRALASSVCFTFSSINNLLNV